MIPPPMTTTDACWGSELVIGRKALAFTLLNHLFQILTTDNSFETLCFMSKTPSSPTVQTAIAENYADLSDALRAAADFVVANPFEVATRSVRSLAESSDISLSSFSRLARAIGYDNYEALRDNARSDLASQSDNFSNKARKLHDNAEQPLLPRQARACIANINSLEIDIDQKVLNKTVSILAKARHVTIVGALGSAGIADYLAYLVSWFDGRWTVAGRNGITLASSLTRLTAKDAVVVISKAPYARRSVLATEVASKRGAKVIALTDSHTFPGLPYTDYAFFQRSETPQFFSSYAATLVLIETIAGMLVAQAGSNAVDEIQKVVEQNSMLDEITNP